MFLFELFRRSERLKASPKISEKRNVAKQRERSAASHIEIQ